jgi:hypothetical protein
MKDKDLAHGILTATVAALAEDEELVVKTQEEWLPEQYRVPHHQIHNPPPQVQGD